MNQSSAIHPSTISELQLAPLSPFHDRGGEASLFFPLVGSSMLELGNKVNRERTYKRFFESFGYRHVSVDINGKDGALKLDLREPLNLGTFDMVTNIGTSEHVSEQEPCWRNIAEAMHVGSVLVSHTPLPGHWWWHGEYYPTASWYREFARLNGMVVERLYEDREFPIRLNCARMVRVADVPFQMPAEGMVKNEIRPR